MNNKIKKVYTLLILILLIVSLTSCKIENDKNNLNNKDENINNINKELPIKPIEKDNKIKDDVSNSTNSNKVSNENETTNNSNNEKKEKENLNNKIDRKEQDDSNSLNTNNIDNQDQKQDETSNNKVVDNNTNNDITNNNQEISNDNKNTNNNEKDNSNSSNNNIDNEKDNKNQNTNPSCNNKSSESKINNKQEEDKSQPKQKEEKLNWDTYIDEDNKERRILWLKGIQPPKMGIDGDFKKEFEFNYLNYKAPYIQDKGYYDQNKSKTEIYDLKLCFAAVASNMLYYWIFENIENIKKYIENLTKNNYFENIEPNTLKDLRYYINNKPNQEKSIIYDLFKLYFKDKNGFQTDIVIDFFINGYTPNPNGGTNWEENFEKASEGGFFYEVFKEKILTERFFSGNLKRFSLDIYKRLSQNYSIGIEHTIGSRQTNHIVTLWGAEFDENNIIKALYVTDSDDQHEKNVGIKRYIVVEEGNRVKINNNIKHKHQGSYIEYVHTLKTNLNDWENYFNKGN